MKKKEEELVSDDIKTPIEAVKDHYEYKDIFNKFDLEIDHIKLHHFTESDKRKVMELFLSNEEV